MKNLTKLTLPTNHTTNSEKLMSFIFMCIPSIILWSEYMHLCASRYRGKDYAHRTTIHNEVLYSTSFDCSIMECVLVNRFAVAMVTNILHIYV